MSTVSSASLLRLRNQQLTIYWCCSGFKSVFLFRSMDYPKAGQQNSMEGGEGAEQTFQSGCHSTKYTPKDRGHFQLILAKLLRTNIIFTIQFGII